MNRKWRGILSVVLIMILSVSAAFAAGQGQQMGQVQGMRGNVNYSDMGHYTWGVNELSELTSSGLLYGYEDGTFRPANAVTEVEAVAMVVRMMGWQDDGSGSGVDMENVPTWAEEVVKIASQNHLFDGMDPLDPSQECTREEIAQYVANAYGLGDEVGNDYQGARYLDEGSISNDRMAAVYAMKSLGLMIGDNLAKFNPVTSVSRLEMAMIMHRHCHTWRYRHLTGQEYAVDEMPNATILIDGEPDRYHISLTPMISIGFDENVYFEQAGNVFSETELKSILTIEDDEGTLIEYSVDIDPDMWEITPEALAYNTTYHLQFDGTQVVDSDGNIVKQQTEAYFTTVAQGDLYVESVDPSDNEEDVPVDTSVVIVFNDVAYEKDDPSMPYDDSTAQAVLSISGFVGGSWTTLDMEDYEVDVEDETWTVTFDEELAFNQWYRVDLDQSELAGFTGDDDFLFRTVGETALSFEPEGDAVPVDAVMTLLFGAPIDNLDDEAIDEDDAQAMITVTRDAVEIPFEVTVEHTTDATLIVIADGDLLSYDTQYTVEVDEDLIAGGIIGETLFDFTTEAIEASLELRYADETLVAWDDETESYLAEGLEALVLTLDESAVPYVDDVGTVLADLTLTDFIDFDLVPGEDFTLVVNPLEDHVFEILFRALEPGDYAVTVSGIHFDESDPESYFGNEPMVFELTLE